MNWLDKYNPKHIKDIIGNDYEINFICGWLDRYEQIKAKNANIPQKTKYRKNKKQATTEEETEDTNVNTKIKELDSNQVCGLVIVGNHGVGKTCIINAICETMQYDTRLFNFSNIKKNEDIDDAISKINNPIYVTEGRTKKVIIIDNLESICSNGGKACVTALIKNNSRTMCNYPIICISNGKHGKVLTEIKKMLYMVKIGDPSYTSMNTLYKNICVSENILIDEENTNKIIEHVQKDYRRLILTLFDLKQAYKTKKITNNNLLDYLKQSNKKDEDCNIYKTTEILTSKYKDIDTCMRYYNTDKVILPLMIQQNYMNCITNKNIKLKEKMDEAKNISRSLSQGDVIENYIYGEQDWDISELHGYYTCVQPSYILCEDEESMTRGLIEYPEDLSKASTSKINKKNINNTNKVMNNKNIHDYMYMNMIFKEYVNNNKYEECGKIMQEYNIEMKSFETLLKVNKIKNQNISLKTKQKKEILK